MPKNKQTRAQIAAELAKVRQQLAQERQALELERKEAEEASEYRPWEEPGCHKWEPKK